MSEGEQIRPEVGQGIELRGYELAELIRAPDGGERWKQVIRYNPDDRGFRKAAADGEYFTAQHPLTTYRVRPILSMPFPPLEPEEAQPASANDGATAQPAPEEAPNG